MEVDTMKIFKKVNGKIQAVEVSKEEYLNILKGDKLEADALKKVEENYPTTDYNEYGEYDEFNENDNLITEFDEEWDNTPEDIEIPEDEDLNPEDYEKYYTEVYISGKLSIDEDPENFRITEEVYEDNKILLGKDVNFLIEPSKEEDRQTAIRSKESEENVRKLYVGVKEWDNTPEDIEIPEDEDLNPEDYEKYYTEVYISGKLSIDEDPENF